MAAASQASETLTLAPQQLSNWLWSDPSQQVYAVAMGARLPQLASRLAQAYAAAELLDFECLLPGALSDEQRQQAAYLVQLRQNSPFSDWLLYEVTESLGDWGLVLRSPAGLMAMRSHARELCEARLPDGTVIQLDWMDPRVLQALFPTFAPQALQRFCGPVTEWLVPGAARWRVAGTLLGQLQWRDVLLAKAAAS